MRDQSHDDLTQFAAICVFDHIVRLRLAGQIPQLNQNRVHEIPLLLELAQLSIICCCELLEFFLLSTLHESLFLAVHGPGWIVVFLLWSNTAIKRRLSLPNRVHLKLLRTVRVLSR